MTVKISVKGRFVFNGKVYGSLEELPEHVQDAYRKAAAGSPAGSLPGLKVKVIFNGVEYDSADAMPAEERRLYEDALAMARSGHLAPASTPDQGVGGAGPVPGEEPGALVSAAPIEPGSAGARRAPIALVLGLMLLLTLLGFYLYTSAAPK